MSDLETGSLTSLSELNLDMSLGELNDIPELLDTYDEKRGYGRRIRIVNRDPIKKDPEISTAGVILPTSNPHEHVIPIRTGEIFVVGPKSTKPDAIVAYLDQHLFSPFPFFWNLSPELQEESTQGLVHNLSRGATSLNNRVLDSNLNGVNADLIRKIQDARTTAEQIRIQRLDGMDISRQALLGQEVEIAQLPPQGDIVQLSTPHRRVFDMYQNVRNRLSR